jgi:hypothetical protein
MRPGVNHREKIMQTKNPKSGGPKLGDMVATIYELGSAVAPDRATAGDLAARSLGRILARGHNARLAITLSDLARDLAVG